MNNHLGKKITLDNWRENLPLDVHVDEEEDLIAFIEYLLSLNDKAL